MNKRRKRIVIGLGATALMLAAGFYLSGESFYPKQTRAEILWKRIWYSADNQAAAIGWLFNRQPTFTLDVPFHKQENPLTCETAALRMVLNYYQLGLSEDELLKLLNFDVTSPMSPDKVWGDPDKGFVGRVDGSVFHGTGYGVYDAPIRNLAKRLKGAVELKDPSIDKIVGLVQGGKPVIVWGLLSNRPPMFWDTPTGKTVEAYPGEHARVVIGYTGDQHDPKKLILLDPIYGRIQMDTNKFVKEWNTQKRRTVVVY